MTTIAMLGLGAMGLRMAENLVKAGHDLRVYNRTAARAEPLVRQGATAADSPRQAAAGSDVVISMVTDDDAARSVWLDEDTGALAGMRPGAVAIECSTVTPGFIAALAEASSTRGVGLLDAPVAGSRPQAEAGQLIHFVGGDAETLGRARPLLDTLGGAVHHVGPVGAGAVVKLAVNALFGVQVAAMAEMLGMLQRHDITPVAAAEVLGALPITSPALAGIAGLIAARKFAPMFPIDLVHKDFGYVAQAAARGGGSAPTAAAAQAVYARAIEAGHGGDNITGVAKLFVHS